MATEYTHNFRLAKPDFRTSPWSDQLNANADRIDNLIYNAISAGNVSVFANNVLVDVGAVVYDPDLNTFFVNNTAHTTIASGSFADERVEYPDYWSVLNFAYRPRGRWSYATTYEFYDIAYDPIAGTTGICIEPHTTGSSGTMRDDPTRWVYIMDLDGFSSAVIAFDNTGTSLIADNVQDAIAELDDDLTNEIGNLQGQIDDITNTDIPNVQDQIDDVVTARTTVPTRQVLTTLGAGVYTPTSPNVVWIEVEFVAGGGGGGAAGTTVGTQPTYGSDTTFNGVVAKGGGFGNNDNGGDNGKGGLGGSGGTGTTGVVFRRYGEPGQNASAYFGGGSGGSPLSGGVNPAGNTNGFAGGPGGIGGGGGSNYSTPRAAGGGGGGGEYVKLRLPAGTYNYNIGDGGAGGIGTHKNGGKGGQGMVLVTEYY